MMGESPDARNWTICRSIVEGLCVEGGSANSGSMARKKPRDRRTASSKAALRGLVGLRKDGRASRCAKPKDKRKICRLNSALMVAGAVGVEGRIKPARTAFCGIQSG